MATFFSESLVKMRKAAGFPTAYRFYHDNAGKPVLKFSYRTYLLFEQGSALPPPEALGRISVALKLIPKSPPAGQLASAWLKTMTGDEPYTALFEPFISVKTEALGLSPMHKAMGKFVKKTPISVEQAVLILSTYDHYRAFLALANDEGTWSAETLAKLIGTKAAATAKVLADLGKKGLTRKIKEGIYTFNSEGIILEFPRAEIMSAGLNDKMREYQAKMLSGGTLAWRRLNVLRADAQELTAFYPVLSLSMSAATGYGVTEKTKHSAMFAIESKAVKLFDF